MTVFLEHQDRGYAGRTRENASSAEATLAIAADFGSAGERLTKRYVTAAGRLYVPINYHGHQPNLTEIKQVIDRLNKLGNIEIALNVAGNSLATLAEYGYDNQYEIDDHVFALIAGLVRSPYLIPKIVAIRSGGQSGMDEAGLKAAERLGIPALCLAPRTWRFLKADGTEVADKHEFIRRFA
jgi:hypothetical protein